LPDMPGANEAHRAAACWGVVAFAATTRLKTTADCRNNFIAAIY
jgi:hypothetical protein